MVKKEFNLKEERKKLFHLFRTTGMYIDSLQEEIEKQDKEFIKILKKHLVLLGKSEEFIDKLSGEKLNEKDNYDATAHEACYPRY